MGLMWVFYPWGLILQAIALVHFARRRPETFWLWVIILGGGLGSLVYIVVEVAPDLDLLRVFVNRFGRRRRMRALEALVQVNPAVGNREELADLYLEEGHYARARELYDGIVSSRLDSLDPFYRRGIAALELGDVDAARDDFEYVVTRDRKYDFHRAIGLLAHASARSGRTADAERLFQEAVAISTLSETYFNYATFLAGQQRAGEARDFAGRILAKKPTMPRYLRRRERHWFSRAKALVKKLPASRTPDEAARAS
jgi:hypothetical protein